MIRGYFSVTGRRRRPFVSAVLDFPDLNLYGEAVQLLVDTGADRTVLAPLDAYTRLGLDAESLPAGNPSTGVGGRTQTRSVSATLTLGDYSTALALAVLDPPEPLGSIQIPSLLGRDVISRFALFVDDETDRIFLLTREEAGSLVFPAGPAR